MISSLNRLSCNILSNPDLCISFAEDEHLQWHRHIDPLFVCGRLEGNPHRLPLGDLSAIIIIVCVHRAVLAAAGEADLLHPHLRGQRVHHLIKTVPLSFRIS